MRAASLTINTGGGGGASGIASITGGTATGLTSLGIRSTDAAFDLTLASAEVLTAGRSLSFNVGDGNRVLTIPATGTAALLGVANVFTGANRFASGTLTADAPAISVSQTWNNGAISFTGVKIAITNNASSSSDLFSVFGGVAGNTAALKVTDIAGAPAVGVSSIYGLSLGWSLEYFVNGLRFGNTRQLAWSSTVNYYDGPDVGLARSAAGVIKVTDGSAGFGNVSAGDITPGADATYSVGSASFRYTGHFFNVVAANIDVNGYLTVASFIFLGASYEVKMYADAANIFAIRSSTSAQTVRVYGTYTDASNYERLAIITTAGAYSLKPEAAGTGTLRTLQISGLPTSNPGPGILWNNAGTPAIGT